MLLPVEAWPDVRVSESTALSTTRCSSYRLHMVASFASPPSPPLERHICRPRSAPRPLKAALKESRGASEDCAAVSWWQPPLRSLGRAAEQHPETHRRHGYKRIQSPLPLPYKDPEVRRPALRLRGAEGQLEPGGQGRDRMVQASGRLHPKPALSFMMLSWS